MSISFKPLEPIPFKQLFDGSLEKFGIVEDKSADSKNGEYFCLTDGENYLWVYKIKDDDDIVSLTIMGWHGRIRAQAHSSRIKRAQSRGAEFVRYAGNNADYILDCISQVFNVRIVSEFEPEYWGFAIEEEWEAAMVKQEEPVT